MKALKVAPLDSDPVLMTIAEGRAALRVGKHQFSELRKAGLIETVTFGRSVRVVAASVRALPEKLRDASKTTEAA